MKVITAAGGWADGSLPLTIEQGRGRPPAPSPQPPAHLLGSAHCSAHQQAVKGASFIHIVFTRPITTRERERERAGERERE